MQVEPQSLGLTTRYHCIKHVAVTLIKSDIQCY